LIESLESLISNPALGAAWRLSPPPATLTPAEAGGRTDLGDRTLTPLAEGVPPPLTIKTAFAILDDVEIELNDLLKELVEKDDIAPRADTVLKDVIDKFKLVESARGSEEEIEPLQKKFDKCVEQLALVKRAIDSRKVHDKINLHFGVDYLGIFNNDYGLVKVALGVDIPLWHRLIITPQFGVVLSTSISEGDQHWHTDPATGETKIKREKGVAGGYAGGLGVGVLAYRSAGVSLLIGAEGLMGQVNELKETFGLALGKLELRLFPSTANFGVGLSLGGGTYCSVTNSECYGMLQTGIKFFLPIGRNIH